jgi:hypothetical protein
MPLSLFLYVLVPMYVHVHVCASDSACKCVPVLMTVTLIVTLKLCLLPMCKLFNPSGTFVNKAGCFLHSVLQHLERKGKSTRACACPFYVFGPRHVPVPVPVNMPVPVCLRLWL